MKQLCITVTALLALATPAAADACDDLISSVEGALSMNSAPGETRSQLEQLLNMGRSAKAQGNIAACEAAITGSLQSPRPRGAGHKCESDKTV